MRSVAFGLPSNFTAARLQTTFSPGNRCAIAPASTISSMTVTTTIGIRSSNEQRANVVPNESPLSLVAIHPYHRNGRPKSDTRLLHPGPRLAGFQTPPHIIHEPGGTNWRATVLSHVASVVTNQGLTPSPCVACRSAVRRCQDQVLYHIHIPARSEWHRLLQSSTVASSDILQSCLIQPSTAHA